MLRVPAAALAAVIVSGGVLLAGCGRTETAAPAAGAAPPVAVAVAPIQGVDEPVVIEATGSFQPDETSDVAPAASGRVIATPVDVGQFVAQGAVLIRIQDVDARLRLDEARATVARAEANLKLAESQNALARATAQRNEKLLAGGLVPQTVAEEARTQAETAGNGVSVARASLAQARAQLALADKAVADVVVSAPFAGYVSERRVAAGEFVQPSTSVLTLMRIDPIRLRLTIPAVQAGQIAIGQTVQARVDAFPDKVFEGRISALNPAIAAESRSFAVEARIANPGALLKPGMFAVASVQQGRTERAMLVPRRAVVEDVNTNSFRVFVIDQENRARLRVVQLAARQPQPEVTRLLGGVKEGERVATSRLGDLYDGALTTLEPSR